MPRRPARDEEVLAAWDEHRGHVENVARALGMHHNTVQYYVRKLGLRKQKLASGVVKSIRASRVKNHAFILTSAQNNTYIHEKFWGNLKAYAEKLGARILVGTFSYNKNAYGTMSVKKDKTEDPDEYCWYDPALRDHFADERLELSKGLVWAGEQNIIPTAIRPLQGLESYTRDASGIFPHAKLSMESVASAQGESAKFNYTTGSVTLRNYIAKKAGLRAEFHHCYSALIVEVGKDRRWYVRQLNADEDGTFYDLGVKVENGACTEGKWVTAINWGDVHASALEPYVQEMCWGKGGILDILEPAYQFFHDLVDFYPRNHHDIWNHHRRFERFVEGRDSVQDEINGAAQFLREATRAHCQSIVVDSNHDNALERWLRDASFKNDPINAVFYLESQLALYKAKAAQNEDFHLIEWAVTREAECPPGVRFLRQDESFKICNGEVECGMHGHLGPDGSRGNPASLARMGHKANTGHTHSAKILEGLYVAGISATLRPRYVKGPSSWSHSHVITYENAKRTIITSWGDGWRA